MRNPFRRRYGFTPPEVVALRGAGIHTERALWAGAGTPPDDPLEQLADEKEISFSRLRAARRGNPDESPDALAKAIGIPVEQLRAALDAKPSAKPLARLTAETGIPVKVLRQALAKGAGRDARRVPHVRPGLLGRHWLDIVVLGGVFLVASLALRPEKPVKREPFAQTVGPVAAFQLIRAADVTDTTATAPAGALRRDAIPGRIALRHLAAGEAVTAADLGPRMTPEALAGRAVVSLSTHPTRAPVAPRAGTRVGVVLSPRAPGGGAGAVLGDVLVLSVARTDSTLRVVAAVPQGDLPAIAALAGSSDVHLVAAPATP